VPSNWFGEFRCPVTKGAGGGTEGSVRCLVWGGAGGYLEGNEGCSRFLVVKKRDKQIVSAADSLKQGHGESVVFSEKRKKKKIKEVGAL